MKRRKRRNDLKSPLRFLVPNHFRMLLDSIETQIDEFSDEEEDMSFPILESLVGLLGGKTVLDAVRWQQCGLIRKLEADSRAKAKKKKFGNKFSIGPSLAMTFCRGPSDSSCVDQTKISRTNLYSNSPFFQVLPMRASNNPRHLLSQVNYCFCKYYEKQVRKRKNRITCAHALAVWMSRCFGSYAVITMKKRTIHLIGQQFVCRSQEFY
ncbi:unnamed protein product [Cylicocyclus nassatus]|uniref:SWIM-type domain-containing protein n=1 Tax=Cylicocyclus nassatus TaxID=53992 RepID=A0AA36HEP1_CYLNA|nr:unnamed protein product [Cylicocyclus nassatus]